MFNSGVDDMTIGFIDALAQAVVVLMHTGGT